MATRPWVEVLEEALAFQARSWTVGSRTLLISHLPDRVQVALCEQEIAPDGTIELRTLAWFPTEAQASEFASLMDAGVAPPDYGDATYASGTYGG